MKYKNNTLFLQGKVDKFTVKSLLQEFSFYKEKPIKLIDLSDVETLDSAGVAFLDQIKQILQNHNPVLTNAKPELKQTMNIFSTSRIEPQPSRIRIHIFEYVGNYIYLFLGSIKKSFILAADIIYWSIIGVFDPKGQRKGSVITQSVLIGVDALGIITLLSFILGLILALQSAAQLRQFGANIYVADLIAISMVREMGPMMTAILVAGRSGSSIASEIATMKVTEEIDALKMMAIDPIRYVVVPKFHAITICMPLLVTMSTLIGIIGGLIIAVTYLDLSAISYLNEAFNILTIKDVVVGLLKSVFFAWVIVIIGSYYGFNAKGGAEGVGKVTTLSVVASIFWVIVLDALNSLIFYF